MSTFPNLKDFRHEINRLFNKTFMSDEFPLTFGNVRYWYPEVDIEEENKEYQIKANLPGIKREDIEIYFNNGILCIQGKHIYEKEDKDKNYLRRERVFGRFSRSFTLPDADVEADIEAKFDNGVLKVVIPKIKSSEMRRIEIKP